MITSTLLALLLILFAGESWGDEEKCNFDGYQKSGCFKRNAKLFHDLLITDLDPTHDKWGKDVDWDNFQDAIQSLACRCEKMARGKGYAYFAIGFYGECWAGKNKEAVATEILNPGSHASSECIGGDYGICDKSSKELCAGIEDNEYVYEIVPEQPPVPTSPPSIAPYRKLGDGEKCPTQHRIKSETACKKAASELGLTWAHTWHNPRDVPGCIFANDGRSKVYFNTALNANGAYNKYAEICSVSYSKLGDGGKCPTGHRIRSEATCRKAASDLGLTWSNTWWSPTDVPGCIFANDGRSKVYFNTALDANGANRKYAEICSAVPTIINVEYKFSTAKTTWDAAEKDCQSWGGHIATPTSLTENTELWNQLKSRPGFGHVWLGITDKVTEGQWVSVQTNTVLKFTSWHKGEPNNLHSEHCGMMYSNTGSWNDISCGSKWNYVCEKPILPPVEYKFGSQKTTWDAAEKDCQSWGGHIATPTSQTENTELWNQIKSRSGFLHVWLGITDKVTEGQWISVQTNTLLKFTSWHKGEPNNLHSEHCGMMYHNTGSWNDISCGSKWNYVCKKGGEAPAAITEVLTPLDEAFKYISVDRSKKPYQVTVAMTQFGGRPTAKGQIDETNGRVQTGYVVFPDDRPYNFWYHTEEATIYWDHDKGKTGNIWRGTKPTYKYVATKKTWAAAQADCKAWGGHLAHVANKQENDMHLKEMRSRHGFSNAWIGLTDAAKEGQWIWTGTITRAWFTNWNRGEPNNLGKENCVHMFLPTGLWNDLRCSASLPYICQKDGTSKLLSSASRTKYVYEPSAKTWSDAEKDCKERGGNLASIINQQENTEVWNELKKRPGFASAWIGLTDQVTENRWILSGSGKVASYTKWSKGEPNNLKVENCAEMYVKAGTWNDQSCSDKLPYVCQSRGH